MKTHDQPSDGIGSAQGQAGQSDPAFKIINRFTVRPSTARTLSTCATWSRRSRPIRTSSSRCHQVPEAGELKFTWYDDDGSVYETDQEDRHWLIAARRTSLTGGMRSGEEDTDNRDLSALMPSAHGRICGATRRAKTPISIINDEIKMTIRDQVAGASRSACARRGDVRLAVPDAPRPRPCRWTISTIPASMLRRSGRWTPMVDRGRRRRQILRRAATTTSPS